MARVIRAVLLRRLLHVTRDLRLRLASRGHRATKMHQLGSSENPRTARLFHVCRFHIIVVLPIATKRFVVVVVVFLCFLFLLRS